MSQITVAVLGAGKIGEPVAQILAKRKEISKVFATRRTRQPNPRGHDEKLTILLDSREAAKRADVVLVAVKAGDARQLAEQISGVTKGKLVISLMAAISIAKLQHYLPGAKVVRAMPNIAATIGEAVTAYCFGAGLTDDDRRATRMVLGCLGEVVEVPESNMDAVTALSGSGPAYIAILIDAMVTAGLKVGLPRDVSFLLATKTLTGTANLLTTKGMHPSTLRDAVTTPAGTTIAGIYELEKGSFRTSIIDAVEAATGAAQRVAKKFEES